MCHNVPSHCRSGFCGRAEDQNKRSGETGLARSTYWDPLAGWWRVGGGDLTRRVFKLRVWGWCCEGLGGDLGCEVLLVGERGDGWIVERPGVTSVWSVRSFRAVVGVILDASIIEREVSRA